MDEKTRKEIESLDEVTLSFERLFSMDQNDLNRSLSRTGIRTILEKSAKKTWEKEAYEDLLQMLETAGDTRFRDHHALDDQFQEMILSGSLSLEQFNSVLIFLGSHYDRILKQIKVNLLEKDYLDFSFCTFVSFSIFVPNGNQEKKSGEIPKKEIDFSLLFDAQGILSSVSMGPANYSVKDTIDAHLKEYRLDPSSTPIAYLNMTQDRSNLYDSFEWDYPVDCLFMCPYEEALDWEREWVRDFDPNKQNEDEPILSRIDRMQVRDPSYGWDEEDCFIDIKRIAQLHLDISDFLRENVEKKERREQRRYEDPQYLLFTSLIDIEEEKLIENFEIAWNVDRYFEKLFDILEEDASFLRTEKHFKGAVLLLLIEQILREIDFREKVDHLDD